VNHATSRQHLVDIYHAAIAAIQPDRAVCAGLELSVPDTAQPLHLLAIGKAARTMLRAAVTWCAERGVPVTGGVCISHEQTGTSLPETFVVSHGDHPHPDDASTAAAHLLRTYVQSHVHPGSHAVVLLSGGTSALIGAPAGVLTAGAYRACCRMLLRSGLDIHAHNALRRQLAMWGNGRLGAALQQAGAAVTVLAISDVPGDAPVSIGSAPCIATEVSPAENEVMLAAASLSDDERSALRDALWLAAPSSVRTSVDIVHHIVSSNQLARAAVAAAAGTALRATVIPELLVDDAMHCGAIIARQLVESRATVQGPTLFCWGGEPVVSLPADAPPGGRMQALALAASRALHEAGGEDTHGITILAAGSDGRDGATDAAGAVVDGRTWAAIESAGHDAEALLAAHDSHTALRSAGCLIPAFASGTNVNDLVIALVEPPHDR
jgi:glycerate 2-kinase